MKHPDHKTCHHEIYGLSCGDFDTLLKRSNGKCEVCGITRSDTPRKLLYIDHDNQRGTGWDHVRGLVCPGCNVGLQFVDHGTKAPTGAQSRYLERAWFWIHHPSPEPPKVPETTPGRQISVKELRENLAEVLNAAGVRGEIIYVTNRGRELAAIVPVSVAQTADQSAEPHPSIATADRAHDSQNRP